MVRNHRFFSKSIVAIALLGLLVTPAQAMPVDKLSTFVIVLPSDAKRSASAVEAAGGRVDQVLENIDTLIVKLPSRAADRLSANNPQWIIEEDQIFSISETQSSVPSWGIDRVDQTLRPLDGKYSYPASEQGQGVTAYVMDTGIRRDHVEFGGRVIQGYQGYTDTSGTGDCQGHGTHVAGTIGGSTVGIAKQVNLVAVTVLSCSGSGSVSVISAGANWIVGHKTGPAVANMSLGGGVSSTLDAVVDKMANAGVSVVVAAGNSSADACNYSPARAPRAITVGSTTTTDSRSSFSNFGACLDLFAPGSSIRSASHLSATGLTDKSGTSMASPHVAGVVARYLTAYPTHSPEKVWEELNKSLTVGVVSSAGSNSPNKLLFASQEGYTTSEPPAPTAPNQVTGLTIGSVGETTVSLSWSAPADGGAEISNYEIDYATNNSFTSGLTRVTSISNSTVVSGLASGTTYYFRVAARNSVGVGEWSEARNTTTQAVTALPGSPGLFTATATSNSSIGLTWTKPAGDVSDYVLQMSTQSNFRSFSSWTIPGNVEAFSVTGLKSRTTYYFRIAARNSSGQSAWSNARATTPR